MKQPSPLIAGRYQIEGLIATGGMAEVFLATELGPKGPLRKVAIKKILPQFSSQQRFREMFLAESEITARCEHANLIRVYAVLEEGGELYIVEEYIDGTDVAKLIDRLIELDLKMPEELCALIALQVARGLDYIHNLVDDSKKPLNIVHRDINPTNIMISKSGDVKILDFGIAKHLGRDLTNPNELKGKIGYLAPEQIAQKNLGAHTDLYCLGLVLYELLTLKPAIKGNTDSELLAFAREPNITPAKEFRRDLSDELEKILDKLLKVDIAERYKSASELERDLLNYFSKRSLLSNKELGKFVESLEIEQELKPWRETAVLFGDRVERLVVPSHAPTEYKGMVRSQRLKRALPFVALAVIALLISLYFLISVYFAKPRSAQVVKSEPASAMDSIRIEGTKELFFYMIDDCVVPVLPFEGSTLDYGRVKNKPIKFFSSRYASWKYVVKTRRKTPVKAVQIPILIKGDLEDNYQNLEVDGQKRTELQFLNYGWHLIRFNASDSGFHQELKSYTP